MSLEISEVVAIAVDVILLTFILVWRERQHQRVKSPIMPDGDEVVVPVINWI